MKITVHAEGTAEQIYSQLQTVAQQFYPNSPAPGGPINPPTAKPGKPKADAPKTETVAEAVVAAVAPVTDLFGDDKPAAPKITKKELIEKMTLVTTLDKDMSRAKALLEKFGAKKLSDVAEARWAEYVDACNALLAAK